MFACIHLLDKAERFVLLRR